MGAAGSAVKSSGTDALTHIQEVTEAAQLATSGGALEQDLSSRIEIHVRVS